MPTGIRTQGRMAGGKNAASAASNSGGVGSQGTLGGLRMGLGGGGRKVPQIDSIYLWVLVLLEVAAIGGLRRAFRRHHGG